MTEDEAQAAVIPPVERSLDLIPVGLKEAALDSPTFRATAAHFAEQVESIEKWLDGYSKAASKLAAEVSTFEAVVNAFLAHSLPPTQLSEAIVDHDYTLLLMQRYGEGAREFWQDTLKGAKRYDTIVIEPIKSFLHNDLKQYKEARRVFDTSQRNFDGIITRYMGQSKTKEVSSLREDAFQLHEARKAYLKSSMDFCVQAPQLRASLDKLVVKVFSDQWREMRTSREANATVFTKWTGEIERVRGWSREMEHSERAFKRELNSARRQIEDSAEQMTRPSRELEDYSAHTVPFLGAASSNTIGKPGEEKSEKQGWLFVRSTTGKAPVRTVWSRRWFYVKHGIFGWLVQGLRSGGVEESERTGVLLCSIRPVFQEERRFCFEVKTNYNSVVLQAETQQELIDWMSSFEFAKRKALEDPGSTEKTPQVPGIDPAFAISPPVAPEFAVKTVDGHIPQNNDDAAGTLLVPEREGTNQQGRASFDVNSTRRASNLDKDSEGTRDHSTRKSQKLDSHKRSTASPQLSQGPTPGGIASLISASHTILPVGPGVPPSSIGDSSKRNFSLPSAMPPGLPKTSLTPTTLANPPAATNLSHMAVIVGVERGVGLGRGDGTGMPSGILANLWGSSNWANVNRLNDEHSHRDRHEVSNNASRALSASQDDSIVMDGMTETTSGHSPRHKKNFSVGSEVISVGMSDNKSTAKSASNSYPINYPLSLKSQDVQFRLLFPSAPEGEKVVLVFRATWNPNHEQEFPGRVYVTEKDIYFYSNHLGLVLITSVSLASIEEVTAAPGRDCDFLYLHLKESRHHIDARRVTVKVFLEPLKLLQRRLNFLVRHAKESEEDSLENVIRTLIKMETEQPHRSSSVESWEDVGFDADNTASPENAKSQRHRNLKASLRIDGNLYGDPAKTGRQIQRFKLPAQPVNYSPQGMQANISREFNVSAKALFHVMFGDKSAVFQLLHGNRWSDVIVQTPWTKPANGHWTRKLDSPNPATPVAETQTIDIFNDHLCYVVSNAKYPWRLPYAQAFTIITKFVITHSAKSRCKLAIFQNIVWQKPPIFTYLKHLIERQALMMLEADAIDLTTVAMDQVNKLGNHSKTNKAIDIFGNIGHQTQAAKIDGKLTQSIAPIIPSVTPKTLSTRFSVGRLLANDILEKSLNLLGLAVDILVALVRSVAGLCTAHTLILSLLLTSALFNGWHGYRDSWTWYTEMRAASFMARIGVVPNPVVSKGIYLYDIEELIAPETYNDTFPAFSTHESANVRTCRTSFRDQLAVTSTGPSLKEPHTARLHRSRGTLARYRHDLLVALRVINRVEKEIVLSEWESWVRSESIKCHRMSTLLRNNQHQTEGPNHSIGAPETVIDADLEIELLQYCQSCSSELVKNQSILE